VVGPLETATTWGPPLACGRSLSGIVLQFAFHLLSRGLELSWRSWRRFWKPRFMGHGRRGRLSKASLVAQSARHAPLLTQQPVARTARLQFRSGTALVGGTTHAKRFATVSRRQQQHSLSVNQVWETAVPRSLAKRVTEVAVVGNLPGGVAVHARDHTGGNLLGQHLTLLDKTNHGC
jgi:hypothetical protein